MATMKFRTATALPYRILNWVAKAVLTIILALSRQAAFGLEKDFTVNAIWASREIHMTNASTSMNAPWTMPAATR